MAVFAGAVALSGVSAGAALAGPEWYTSNPVPEWRINESVLTETRPVKWGGHIRLIEEANWVECKDSAEGTVSKGVVGSVTGFTTSECSAGGPSECKTATVTAGKLPWTTELTSTESGVDDMLQSASLKVKCGSGLPITCEYIGSFTVGMRNTSAAVEGAFEVSKVQCPLHGPIGELTGKQTLEPTTGGRLEDSHSGTFTKITKAVSVKEKGTLRLTDSAMSSSIRCEFQASATLEPLGVGKITGLENLGKCTGTGYCEIFNGSADVNLPWKTELAEVGGGFREQVVSGGAGTPEWEYDCDRGVLVEKCGLNTDPRAEFVPSLRIAEVVFDGETNHTNCSTGGAGAGKWEGALSVVEQPRSIEAISIK